MALVFCDSFDHYTATQATRKGWASSWAGIVTGRNGTSGASLNDANNTVAIPAGNSYVCGCAISLAGGAKTGAYFSFTDAGTNQCELRLDSTDMSLDITRNAAVLASSAAGVISASGFQYIEFKVAIANSGGSAEARVNGVSVVSVSSADTQNTANAFTNLFLLRGPLGVHHFDDLYVASGATFLGDIRIKAIYPDSAGNYSQWTPSAGANWQCVDDATPNDDTDYVSTSTAAQKDTYGYGAVGAVGTVKGMQVLGCFRKDDAAARNVRRLVRIGGTDYAGSTVVAGSSYTYGIREILENNPATSAPWTVTEIDGAEFGVELVS